MPEKEPTKPADIAAYTGLAVAVIGSLGVIYNFAATLYVYTRLRRILARNGLNPRTLNGGFKAIIRNRWINGIVEIEMPVYELVFEAGAESPESEVMLENPKSEVVLAQSFTDLKGASWLPFSVTREHFQEHQAGYRLVRRPIRYKELQFQYGTEVRLPEARVRFETLIHFFALCGCKLDLRGFMNLKDAGEGDINDISLADGIIGRHPSTGYDRLWDKVLLPFGISTKDFLDASLFPRELLAVGKSTENPNYLLLKVGNSRANSPAKEKATMRAHKHHVEDISTYERILRWAEIWDHVVSKKEPYKLQPVQRTGQFGDFLFRQMFSDSDVRYEELVKNENTRDTYRYFIPKPAPLNSRISSWSVDSTTLNDDPVDSIRTAVASGNSTRDLSEFLLHFKGAHPSERHYGPRKKWVQYLRLHQDSMGKIDEESYLGEKDSVNANSSFTNQLSSDAATALGGRFWVNKDDYLSSTPEPLAQLGWCTGNIRTFWRKHAQSELENRPEPNVADIQQIYSALDIEQETSNTNISSAYSTYKNPPPNELRHDHTEPGLYIWLGKSGIYQTMIFPPPSPNTSVTSLGLDVQFRPDDYSSEQSMTATAFGHIASAILEMGDQFSISKFRFNPKVLYAALTCHFDLEEFFDYTPHNQNSNGMVLEEQSMPAQEVSQEALQGPEPENNLNRTIRDLKRTVQELKATVEILKQGNSHRSAEDWENRDPWAQILHLVSTARDDIDEDLIPWKHTFPLLSLANPAIPLSHYISAARRAGTHAYPQRHVEKIRKALPLHLQDQTLPHRFSVNFTEKGKIDRHRMRYHGSVFVGDLSRCIPHGLWHEAARDIPRAYLPAAFSLSAPSAREILYLRFAASSELEKAYADIIARFVGDLVGGKWKETFERLKEKEVPGGMVLICFYCAVVLVGEIEGVVEGFLGAEVVGRCFERWPYVYIS